MDVAELVLDYVRTLVWPALVLVVLVRFRRGIGDFLQRIAGESQEFSASGFGVGFTAKFQERLATLAEQAQTADPEELRESVTRAARDLGRDQFQALAADFAELSLAGRRQAVAGLAEVADGMEIGELVEFAGSPITGERVGAAIGLGVHLQRQENLRRDPAVTAALRALLLDRSSLVRYRAAEAARRAPEIAQRLESELRSLAHADRNKQVREMARRALGRAGFAVE
jgi:hypothetical protein